MKVDEIEHIYRTSKNIFEDLYSYFYKNAESLNVLTAPITKDTILFRTRDVDSIDNIKGIEDVQYPPSSPCHSRIGKPNQIWFYTSDHYQACLSEMLQFWYDKYKLGETITVIITSWKIKLNLNIIFIPDFNNDNEVLKHYGINSYFKNDPLWDYICKKFQTQIFDDKNIYQFTSAFSNSLINVAKSVNNHIDGIFYPCVQYPKKSNIALRSSLVDNNSIVLNEIKKIEAIKRSELNENSLPSYDINANPSKELDGDYNPKLNEISWKWISKNG